ncbi:MAG TPA: alpha-amylase family glycosyl hydrolase [Anaerolineaceae bacterium]|nr:alpha-amylase family glycosyl hydrolase [Anaerolineaceae bacterium]
MREFHVSRLARDRYQFADSLFSLSGNVIFANFHAARSFAQKINQNRDLVSYPEDAVKPGQINAMGLIDEILHIVVDLYRQQKNPQVMEEAYAWLQAQIGAEAVDKVLELFTAHFPPVAVYRGEQSAEAYLSAETDGVPNKFTALEELMMLWVANKNPAFMPFEELFDDESLASDTAYLTVVREFETFFETQLPFGPDQENLIQMLRSPAIAVPQSLGGQLEYIRERWADLLGQVLYRLLSSLDLIKEDERMRFLGPGPIPIPVYDRATMGYDLETERFSEDRDWMPRLVLIAKNTYVWLDQLSQKYNRPIRRLDEIPDEELQTLASGGFTGLWLIGLWERSQASARIKQLGGNSEAIASAYSISAYEIAAELGGEAAYQGLRDKAWRHGIRLASDMVPNHMGIDSSWVIEHPDWFIHLDYSPFPSYSFSGPDLSPTEHASILLEDHYYSRTDAAVVFKRVDGHSRQAQYIYHGNDGTSMPWNDTAQLNYLNPAVREAVIQTILSVARRFPIIRFDAAMTLAKKHFQRLWFPEPGTGGAIPSRAEHGMTREQFDQVMPEEFWREVVDRVAQEVPDTLLLAEAFWLMEGYFVRTLGMHRVYNSAFMNMLRNEDNANYRQLIKNTLEFDPEILKRYVNFMNNPDERTAVDQFGKGDKYFGVAVLMATLPGLPMFGHGQVEGYAEKYGMEFKKPYWNETPDTSLVERHEREVFPLLHRRFLFSGIQDFLLYDLFAPEGQVNEDVYAFSNGSGSERALVVYHNRYAEAQGWIRMSAGYAVKGQGDERRVIQRSLAEGLNLPPGPDRFVIFRDSVSNLEYIRSSQVIADQGLYFALHAYEYHVFVDFREVQDDDYHSFRYLADYLNGRGVPSMNQAMKELLLAPVAEPFRQIANPGYIQYLLDHRLNAKQTVIPEELLAEAEGKAWALVEGIKRLTGYERNQESVVQSVRDRLATVLKMGAMEEHFPVPGGKKYQTALDYLRSGLEDSRVHWITLFAWVFLHDLGKLGGMDEHEIRTQSWLEEWQFGRQLSQLTDELGLDPDSNWRLVNTANLLIAQQNWYSDLMDEPVEEILRRWLSQEGIQRYLGINRYKDVLWYNKEAFEEFVWWMTLLAVLEASPSAKVSASEFLEQLLGAHELAEELLAAAGQSEYQVNKLLKALQAEKP